MFLSIALLAASAFLVAATPSSVELGSATRFVIEDTDASLCHVTVEVPESRAGADCEIVISNDAIAAVVNPKFDYYWLPTADLAKAANKTFVAANKLAHQENSNMEKATAKCPTAGSYTLGAKVSDCTGCTFAGTFVAPKADIGLVMKEGNNYHVDIGKTNKWTTPYITVNEEDAVYFHLETTADNQVAHFDIDKCAPSCAGDNYDYFWAEETAANATEVTGDTGNNFKFTMPTAGKYYLKINIKSGLTGTTSQFAAHFQLNAEAERVDFPEARCPLKDCAAADMQTCDECASNGCNWCGGSEFKCTNNQCASETAVTDEDKCVDLGCDEKESCEDCASVQGCVWCDTLKDTIGLGSSGSCSTGKGGLGKSCTSPGADAVTAVEQCPSAASTISVAMATIVGALLLAL